MKLREIIKESVRHVITEGTTAVPSMQIIDLLTADYPELEGLSPEDLVIEPFDYTKQGSWLVLIPTKKMGFAVDLEMNDVDNIGFRQADEMIYGEKDVFR